MANKQPSSLLFVPESHKLEHRRTFSWRAANPINSLGLLRQSATIFGLAAVIFCADLALQCFSALGFYLQPTSFSGEHLKLVCLWLYLG